MSFSFLDFLFPKKCVSCGKLGRYICQGCYQKIEFIEHPVCPVCQRQAIEGRTHPACAGRYGLDGLVVACRYGGPIKSLIGKVKYKWAFDMGKVLVDLVAGNLWKFDLPKDAILTPVPLFEKRKNWRGFNQSELLARELSLRFREPYRDLLLRVRETKTQVGLSKKERKTNVRGAFSINKEVNVLAIKGKDFILVDDVYTSGATMQEACGVLKRLGARRVWAMAVALG